MIMQNFPLTKPGLWRKISKCRGNYLMLYNGKAEFYTIRDLWNSALD